MSESGTILLIVDEIVNGCDPVVTDPDTLARIKDVLQRRWLHTYEARAWWRKNVSQDIPLTTRLDIVEGG